MGGSVERVSGKRGGGKRGGGMRGSGSMRKKLRHIIDLCAVVAAGVNRTCKHETGYLYAVVFGD
jgi:hypothetical protein